MGNKDKWQCSPRIRKPYSSLVIHQNLGSKSIKYKEKTSVNSRGWLWWNM